MKKFSQMFRGERIFVSCSENEAEAQWLSALAAQIRFICSRVKRTGLWVVAEFKAGDCQVLATHLAQDFVLRSVELQALEKYVTQQLKGADHDEIC